VVTKIYADALREGRDPTPEELRRLEHAFSRQGFTDAYYQGETGSHMFGVRENTPEPRELFAEARAAYEKGEGPGVPVKFYAMIRPGEPVQVAAEDSDGRVVTAAGETPEVARTRSVTQADVETQLSKTGGTPYRCTEVRALVEDGLSVPVSALNSLRREVLDRLSSQRIALPERRCNPYKMGARYENPRTEPVINVSLRKASQISFELLRQKPNLIYLPTDEISANHNKVKEALLREIPICAVLPRVCFDRELPELRRQLEDCKSLGITEVLAGNLGLANVAREMGFEIRGDFGLQIFNSQAAKEYKRLGLKSLTASFELKLAQIRDLAKVVDTEMIAYGRLPLMIMENCIIHNHSGRHTCANVNLLTDRKGVRFPVVKAWGCRNEILNANKLFLADKEQDYKRAGLWAIRLNFTTENAMECARVMERYRGQGSYAPADFNRGLYYRDAE
jgi:putative protease